MSYSVSDIATRAANLPHKVKKADAFARVKELAEKPADLDTLAHLYAYFLPPLPAKAKDPAVWVARAKGVNDVRHYLNYLYSDGNRLIATDGHRLHLMPTNLPAGFYDKARNPVDVDAKYPDVDRIIPKLDQGTPHKLEDLAGLPVRTSEVGARGQYTIHAYELPGGVCVNKTYWDQATRDETGIVRISDPTSSVRIDYPKGRLAVIMPIRM